MTNISNDDNTNHDFPCSSWRVDEVVESTRMKKQYGVNPSQFHQLKDAHQHNENLESENKENAHPNNAPDNVSPSKRGRRRRQRQERRQQLAQQLQQVLSQAQANVLVEKKREVSVRLGVQRSAYREVTSLRTWPLQELALRDLDQLLEGAPNHTSTPSSQDLSISASQQAYSSSSGSSSSSILEEEPKRTKSCHEKNETSPISPRKSTLRNQFQQDFLRERDMLFVSKVADDNKNKEEISSENNKEENGEASRADDHKDDAEDAVVSSDNEQTYKDQGTEDTTSTPPTVEDDDKDGFLPALWCMEPRIFAMEHALGGKRKFVVGHLGRFLDRYWRKCDAKHRHYYELIRQGQPCRLYFDLEFQKQANPEITEEISQDLLNELHQEIQQEFERVYKIHNVARSCIVDLDSSTETKFSRHWIIHLPNNALFKDATAVGHFVKNFVGRLADEVATNTLKEKRPTLAKHLFVNTESKAKTTKEKTCFIDLGVYTRNRLFRLLGSAKFGKPASAALRIASTNQFPFPEGFSNECFYVPAMEKAKQSEETVHDKENVPVNLTPKEDVDMSQFMSSVDWTMHADAFALTLVVPMNANKIKFPILSQVKRDDKQLCEQSLPNSRKDGPTVRSLVSSSGVEKSPFPLLDDFIVNSLGTRGGVQGAVRVWSLDGSSDSTTSAAPWDSARSITYQMCRNRWCERIGRAHKSNNIMWTVNLQDLSCVQSCHDPECRMMQFRGTPVPLPKHVCEHVQDVLVEQQLALMDEATVLREKQEASKQEELDDAEFERALLNLDISGNRERDEENDSIDKAHDEKEAFKTENSGQDQEEELLSDATLFDAVLTNPELFP